MQLDKTIANEAIELATIWQNKAQTLAGEFDQKFNQRVQKMLSNPMDKVLLIELMDQSFRSKNTKRVAQQICFLFDKYKMAEFFTTSERMLIFLFRNLGIYMPNISVPFFIDKIKDDTKNVVIKGEENIFNEHLKKRKAQNIRVNVNLIGEEVLGEEESQLRIQKYLNLLENENVDYISIKISTIFSQINSLSFENTVDELVKRLSLIYSHAKKHSFINKNGEKENKFINLDMEEYKDLAITCEVFMKTLDKEEFSDFYAGIVLQAYLPDSHIFQKKLTNWAKKRVQDGKSAVKMRLVKGANMQMEQTQSALKQWELAPYDQKLHTDANYKLMINYALQSEHAKCVHVASASHNLFELAYAYCVARKNDTLEYFNFEMLEGMSDAARSAIEQISGHIILYAPTAKKEQFTNAIAYLVRRLDENTSEENFIRYSFGLQVNSNEWNDQKQKFLDSLEYVPNVFVGSHKTQNRLDENWSDYKGGSFYTNAFKNEPDTDFVLKNNQIWAENIVKKYKKDTSFEPKAIPIVVGDTQICENRQIIKVYDKSLYHEKVICGSYTKASKEDLQKAVQVAHEDVDGWRNTTFEYRHEILSKVANLIRQRRADLIGVAAAEVGKVFAQSDVEVSEAIDFFEFYPHGLKTFLKDELEFTAKGVGLVISPWNFPIAIPIGGIVSSLITANTVILKPASSAVLCAYEFCKCFWEAGISKNILQFVPCEGELAQEHLIKDKRVNFTILTGGENTAMSMLKARYDLYLSAETGGKDATIITALADKEQAIKNVVQSAFSNSGQKCSATSLLVLEDEVFEDEGFKNTLIDATKSMQVGSVWDLKNTIATLANPISGALKQALDDSSSWLIKPEFVQDNPYMLKPCIKWDIQKNSFCHLNELFGPLLSVMRAKDLNDAIDIVNVTGYGLTSGLESLDEQEIDIWKEKINAGNLYINKGTTGAIVLRQPFGGHGKSAIGSGRKAGFYNYLPQFMNISQKKYPQIKKEYYHAFLPLVKLWQKDAIDGIHSNFLEGFKKLQIALMSYVQNYKEEFDVQKDYCNIRGEDNIFRYLPLNKVALRIYEDDDIFNVLSRIFAAKVCNVSLHVSIQSHANSQIVLFLYENKDRLFDKNDILVRESEECFSHSIDKVNRILYADCKNISEKIFIEANKKPVFIVRSNPLMDGRIELLNYFEEQSISHSFHRYGNLGARGV